MMRLNGAAMLCGVAIIFSVSYDDAAAGGFALREQSSYYQGMSFAGNATSGPSISSVFWNPATITGAGDGFTVEAHNSLILPQAKMNGTFTRAGGRRPG
ncbi:Outer membrane protein transport protein (OMPP1/FadL/TodX) [Polymorphum gilvum SL003B-26A1]|uniref:Outer membrane protein transport protein (OMPP1/FadL/TodX) n=2 Tax=Polymorphum TaxID=991903 RepID=F2J3A3_POLGS|nr:Outer membrane protein transport protein (OMPP1/FadL/TodX) [Polymorphum gilvum SL003B-26A1]